MRMQHSSASQTRPKHKSHKDYWTKRGHRWKSTRTHCKLETHILNSAGAFYYKRNQILNTLLSLFLDIATYFSLEVVLSFWEIVLPIELVKIGFIILFLTNYNSKI